MRKLINWRQVSLKLSGTHNSIRKNKCPRKYKLQVALLMYAIEMWSGWIDKMEKVSKDEESNQSR